MGLPRPEPSGLAMTPPCPVIAIRLRRSGATRQSPRKRQDCFVPLAMTISFIFSHPRHDALLANLHGGFILGVIILLVCFFSETTKYLIKKPGPSLPSHSLKSLTVVTAASSFSFINPNLYRVIPLLLAHGNSFESAQIIEWISPERNSGWGLSIPALSCISSCYCLLSCCS